MQYRALGKTGLTVSEIGFGGSRIGGVFADTGGSQAVKRLLHAALDAGINFFDTADMYAQGESESLMGAAFADRRDRVILATKGGYRLPAQARAAGKAKPLLRPLVRLLKLKRKQAAPKVVKGTLTQSFNPAVLMQALEGSLRRLRTDVVDVYQLHSPPGPVLESGEFVETLEKMRQAGKVRHYGVACDTVDQARICLRYPEVSTLQFPFGLLDLEALDGFLAEASARNVGLIARGCFGGGLLKSGIPEEELKKLNVKWPRVLAIRQTAAEMGRPVLDVALHFVLARQEVSTTLLGMRTADHLASNLELYAAPALKADQVAALAAASRVSA